MPRRMNIADLEPSIELPRRNFLAKIGAAFVGMALLARPRPAHAATMDADPWIGEIALVPYTFPPRGWAFCNGQILSIAQNTALFTLLGTTFGGDGQTTFALPDLRGRVPISAGQAPGLDNYALGQVGGVESVTLVTNEIPSHTHTAVADAGNGTSDAPAAHLPARNVAGVPEYGINANASLSSQAIAPTGGGQPHTNLQPYLTMNYIIALVGIYPTQN